MSGYTEPTEAMIEAGLEAYASLAWHDSDSPATPREVVEGVLRAAYVHIFDGPGIAIPRRQVAEALAASLAHNICDVHFPGPRIRDITLTCQITHAKGEVRITWQEDATGEVVA